MNNLYRKVAVASICTALSFTLVANKDAKAATFNLTGTSFSVQGFGSGESFSAVSGSVERKGGFGGPTNDPERRAFYEFDIGNLSLASNTIISSAILNTPFITLEYAYRFLYLDIFGYAGNGRPDLSDFDAGVRIAQEDTISRASSYYYNVYPSGEINFDVTNFVKQRVSNGDDFAGLGIRVGSLNFTSYPNYGRVYLEDASGQEPSLIIETADVAEPVPEPTTILGSALALNVGGWLKRKKSSQQNKTTSQH
jgi:hypothetical protein